ncbi:hypothetical protein BH11GEM2_BH11GEM2_21090 [soil metagenome]
MSLLLKALALKLIAGRTVGGVFGLLTLLLVPLAAVLKFIGLPLVFILGILGAPVFLILGTIGLPLMLVVGIGGALVVAMGLFLTLGILAIKIVLPIVLIVWFVRWLRRRPGTAGVPPMSGPVSDL